MALMRLLGLALSVFVAGSSSRPPPDAGPQQATVGPALDGAVSDLHEEESAASANT